MRDEFLDVLPAALLSLFDLVGVPVDKLGDSTGKLAGSIKATATNRGGVVSAGNARVRYAGPINYGWGSRPNRAKGWRGGPIAANNFLQKGVKASEERIRQIMSDGVSRLLEQVRGIG